MNAAILATSIFATVTFAPPILPFTEISPEKMRILYDHMQEADEITLQDCHVVMQLDHTKWKYERMREILYSTARKATDGDIVNAKDLGKMFDRIDAGLDAEREKELQKVRQEREMIQNQEKNKEV